MSARRRPKIGKPGAINDGVVVAPGDHLLFVDGVFNLKVTSGSEDYIQRRARETYEVNPGAHIIHVMVVATYTAPDDPTVETYAERKME